MRISDWSSDVCSSDLLKADLLEMEKMIDGYLTFARGEGDEPAIVANVSALIESTVAGWQRNGTRIDCHIESHLELPVRDRKRVVEGTGVSGRVELGGRRVSKNKKTAQIRRQTT